MRLAISNIAWSPSDRDAVLAMLAAVGGRGLEIAPGLTFPDEADPFEPSAAAVGELEAVLAAYGLTLVSMQSLLFGVADAQLFGTDAQRDRFRDGLTRAIRLAGRLNVPNLVMGSPGNRAIPEGVARDAAEEQAADVFRQLGNLCIQEGTVLALEPNPVAYGTNFLNRIGEVQNFAERVDHPAITVNFDLGSLHMNDEIDEAETWFDQTRAKVSHVHISEPQLAPAPRDVARFTTIAKGLLDHGYQGWFSIEMRMGENLTGINRLLTSTATALRQAGMAH